MNFQRFEIEGVMLAAPYRQLSPAHARALGKTLVTANVDEFSCVQGLEIANWLA